MNHDQLATKNCHSMTFQQQAIEHINVYFDIRLKMKEFKTIAVTF